MDTCTIDNIGGVDRGGPYHQNVPRARSAALAGRAELGTWIRQALASPRRASAVSPVFLTESAEGALNHRTTSFAWPSRLSGTWPRTRHRPLPRNSSGSTKSADGTAAI